MEQKSFIGRLILIYLAVLFVDADISASHLYGDEIAKVNVESTPVIDPIHDVTACNEYMLPSISGTDLSNDAAYYTLTGGTGTQYQAGDFINNSTTLYAWDMVGDCVTEEMFDVTIVASPVIDPILDIIACNSCTLPFIYGTGLSNNVAYYTGPGGTGTQYQAGDLFNNSATLFVYDMVGDCVAEEIFTVTILGPPVIDPILDITACNSYTLPIISGTGLSNNVAYYTGPGGTGTLYQAGDVINNSTTLYAWDKVGDCVAEEIFNVTILGPPVIDPILDITACNSYTLPIISGTGLSNNVAYYTGPGGTGTLYQAGDVINNSATLYVYDMVGDCLAEEIFNVTIVQLVETEEYDKLLEIYALSNGDNWTTNTGWLDNCDPCGIQNGNDPWFGLTCNGSGQVTTIDLPGNNLTGQLPTSLVDFEALASFDVSNSNLSGNLPVVCGLNIVNFEVNNNQFTGALANCFVEMPSLLALNVSANNLNGIIPSFGPDQENITDLHFHNNSFSGGLPGSLGSISGLSGLSTHDNNLSDCYPQQLIGLCNNPNLQLTNALISDGNASLSNWEDFCSSGTNACCPSNLNIDWSPVYDYNYRSSGDIDLSTDLPDNGTIIFSTGQAGTFNITNDYMIGPNVSVMVNQDGCN